MNAENSGGKLSLLKALRFMSEKCKEKARDVWKNYSIDNTEYSDIFVSSTSYTFNSRGEVTLEMSFDFTTTRSDAELAFRDGGAIGSNINEAD